MDKLYSFKQYVYNQMMHRIKYGAITVYRDALNYFGNEESADQFMISIHGGFTPGELNKVKKRVLNKKEA